MPGKLGALQLGKAYSKRELGELLNEDSLAKVREGIYYCKQSNCSLLFVDLEKVGKEERFHFNDYFEGEFFHWDSQTTQHLNSPKIQEMMSGKRAPYLFARLKQRKRSITQPFVYCGELVYDSHDPDTSKPIHIIFRSLDIDEETNNEELLEIYSWKPQVKGEVAAKNSRNGEITPARKSKFKLPNRTEREGLVTSRVGQGYYRQQVIDKWNATCPVTGSKNLKILIASHIVPWKECNDEERLDEENSILLSPNADALFDRHLISFDERGKMIISDEVDKKDLLKLGIQSDIEIPVTARMANYLRRHRNLLK